MNDREMTKEWFKEIAESVKPVQRGTIYVWYDNAGHYCDVIWLTANTFFIGTEHPEVMALVDSEDNLFGFKVDATPWFDDDENGYMTVNLRSKLASYKEGKFHNFDTEKQPDNPIINGIINIRYSKTGHFFDLFWAGGARYVETESEHILARVDNAGVVCGFKVVNLDRLTDDEHGFVKAFIDVRMETQPPNTISKRGNKP